MTVIQLVKDDNHPLSEVELFTAMESARMRWQGLGMCNTYGRCPEDRIALNRAYNQAEREYLSLLQQCKQRGIA